MPSFWNRNKQRLAYGVLVGVGVGCIVIVALSSIGGPSSSSPWLVSSQKDEKSSINMAHDKGTTTLFGNQLRLAGGGDPDRRRLQQQSNDESSTSSTTATTTTTTEKPLVFSSPHETTETVEGNNPRTNIARTNQMTTKTTTTNVQVQLVRTPKILLAQPQDSSPEPQSTTDHHSLHSAYHPSNNNHGNELNTKKVNNNNMMNHAQPSQLHIPRHHSSSVNLGPEGCVFELPPSPPSSSSSSSEQCSFDSLVVFGDSLSDVGTRQYYGSCLDEKNLPQSHTLYCNNPRISNGPLLVDHIAAQYDISNPLQVGYPGVDLEQKTAAFSVLPPPHGGTNFARTSAVARSNLPGQESNRKTSENSLQQQLSNYKLAMYGKTEYVEKSTKQRLHFVWIGYNDVMEAEVMDLSQQLILDPAFQENLNHNNYNNNKDNDNDHKKYIVDPELVLQAAIDGIMKQLHALYGMPDVCNVYVMGAMDGSLAPFINLMQTRSASFSHSPLLQNIRKYSEYFNQQVQLAIQKELSAKFRTKCTPVLNTKYGSLRASFGIHFEDTVALMDQLFRNNPQKYPHPTESCNYRHRIPKQQCIAAAQKREKLFFTYIPLDGTTTTSAEEDDENDNDNAMVLCVVPGLPNSELDCHCRDDDNSSPFLFYDEIHPSAAFYREMATAVLENLNQRVCRQQS